MKRTINEVYEEIKQLRDGLEVYIKNNNRNPTAKIVLVNNLNIYNDILNQLEESGVLEQLAEKDKEIEKLNLMIKTLPNHDTEMEKEIRKKVCDKIKEKCQVLRESGSTGKIGYLVRDSELDLLEKGEE